MMETSCRKRYAEADVIRSLCMIYIIGVWHLQDYSPHLLQVSSLRGAFDFTYGILGMFFFVSGFLLATLYGGIVEISAVLSFYGKRLLRLYPPYLIALLCFYIFGVGGMSLEVMINSAFLVAVFLSKAPLTLWFINVILLYYLATPFLICGGNSRYVWAIIFAFLLFGLVLIRLQTGLIDVRLFQYVPSFALGLLMALEPGLWRRLLSSWGIASSIVVCAIVLAVGVVTGPIGRIAIWAFCPPLLAPAVWRVAAMVASIPRVVTACRTIGYLSLSAYLIHRLTFGLANRIFHPEIALTASAYWIGLVLPITFAAAYVVQVAYDRGVAALSSSIATIMDR